MFERLPASGPVAAPPVWQGAVSALIHVILIFGAVQASRGISQIVGPGMRGPTTMVWMPPSLPPAAAVAAAPTPFQPSSAPVIQALAAPAVAPVGLPPITLNDRFNPRSFTGRGVAGPAPGAGAWSVGPPGASGESVLQFHQVDLAVVAIHLPVPAYPATLQQLGVTGYVEAQFVVDTVGRAEPDSWSVLNSRHPLFEAPVRTAVMAGRFDPARVRGKAVRQLVRQRFSFTINP